MSNINVSMQDLNNYTYKNFLYVIYINVDHIYLSAELSLRDKNKLEIKCYNLIYNLL